MGLSVLQQELYDLMKKDLLESDLPKFIPDFEDEHMEAFLADLEKDISTMDAIDLRRNIKIWREDV